MFLLSCPKGPPYGGLTDLSSFLLWRRGGQARVNQKPEPTPSICVTDHSFCKEHWERHCCNQAWRFPNNKGRKMVRMNRVQPTNSLWPWSMGSQLTFKESLISSYLFMNNRLVFLKVMWKVSFIRQWPILGWISVHGTWVHTRTPTHFETSHFFSNLASTKKIEKETLPPQFCHESVELTRQECLGNGKQ
jgi:hypothetical protein